MKGTRSLGLRLEKPIGKIAAALICASLLYVIAQHQREAAEQALTSERARASAARERLANTSSEEARLKFYVQIRKDWRERKLIGNEDRLSLVESLQASARATGMPELDLKFETASPTADRPKQGMHWHASTLHFAMTGIDESQLLSFLKKIEADTPALIVVRRCSIALAERSTSEQPRSLVADCTVDALTILPPLEKT